jgi:transposase
LQSSFVVVVARYIHRHRDGLQIFLIDGRVEMDTNPAENTIPPITVNRKNALFAGHDEGGRTFARTAPLIETCKRNGVDPLDYSRETLTTIANPRRASTTSCLPQAVKLKAK